MSVISAAPAVAAAPPCAFAQRLYRAMIALDRCVIRTVPPLRRFFS
jgi:hypothetical protein